MAPSDTAQSQEELTHPVYDGLVRLVAAQALFVGEEPFLARLRTPKHKQLRLRPGLVAVHVELAVSPQEVGDPRHENMEAVLASRLLQELIATGHVVRRRAAHSDHGRDVHDRLHGQLQRREARRVGVVDRGVKHVAGEGDQVDVLALCGIPDRRQGLERRVRVLPRKVQVCEVKDGHTSPPIFSR